MPNNWSKDVRNLLNILFQKDPLIRHSQCEKLKNH